jgi:hypothetical protein
VYIVAGTAAAQAHGVRDVSSARVSAGRFQDGLSTVDKPTSDELAGREQRE